MVVELCNATVNAGLSDSSPTQAGRRRKNVIKKTIYNFCFKLQVTAFYVNAHTLDLFGQAI